MAAENSPEGGRAWYAVHVKSNRERIVFDHLSAAELEAFLPTYMAPSRRTDRRVVLERPLFTGYLFVRMDLTSADRLKALKAPGVVRVVGFGGVPAAVDDEVIGSLKILTGDGEGRARPHPLVREGRRVRVVDGPFAGASGILHVESAKKSRLVVEVEFLGRAVSVPVDEDQVVLERS